MRPVILTSQTRRNAKPASVTSCPLGTFSGGNAVGCGHQHGTSKGAELMRAWFVICGKYAKNRVTAMLLSAAGLREHPPVVGNGGERVVRSPRGDSVMGKPREQTAWQIRSSCPRLGAIYPTLNTKIRWLFRLCGGFAAASFPVCGGLFPPSCVWCRVKFTRAEVYCQHE